MIWWFVGGLLSMSLVVVPAGVARAQSEPASEVDPVRDEEARGYFVAGRAAFAAGRYGDALELFERSYALSGRPTLLYNIGQAADRMRRDARALEAFTLYLEGIPDAANRVEVESRIAALSAALEQERSREAAASAPPEAAVPVLAVTPPTEVDASPRASGGDDLTWLWVGLGVLAAAGIAVAIAVPLAQGPSREVAPPFEGDVGPGGLVVALELP